MPDCVARAAARQPACKLYKTSTSISLDSRTPVLYDDTMSFFCAASSSLFPAYQAMRLSVYETSSGTRIEPHLNQSPSRKAAASPYCALRSEDGPEQTKAASRGRSAHRVAPRAQRAGRPDDGPMQAKAASSRHCACRSDARSAAIASALRGAKRSKVSYSPGVKAPTISRFMLPPEISRESLSVPSPFCVLFRTSVV